MNPHGDVVVTMFLVLFPANVIALWWAVGSPLVLDPNRICRKARRVSGKQREICRKEPDIVAEVVKGARLGTHECQFQFHNRRWNCSTKGNTFGKVLQQDIRETAFVNAVTSAGVVYAVTGACTSGRLLQCTCDHSKKDVHTDERWEWGGCGDNVDFGYKKSAEFMDARPKKKKNHRRSDIRTLLQLHNNEAGRLAVHNNMRKECKCHGLSGSCTLKTCWRKMPYFRHVGDSLKSRFDGAVKVTGSNDGESLIPARANIKRPTPEDLLYTEESPDFCERAKKLGALGTHGRFCNETSPGVGGCDLLCCGRGSRRMSVTLTENCKCRFHWCCEVKCEKCVKKVTLHKCL